MKSGAIERRFFVWTSFDVAEPRSATFLLDPLVLGNAIVGEAEHRVLAERYHQRAGFLSCPRQRLTERATAQPVLKPSPVTE